MIAFIILGIASYFRIPVDRFPDVDFPMVAVGTPFPGANPYVVDANVTRVIEEELATISGVDSIISQSFTGMSRIIVMFNLDKDIDKGVQEVRDAVRRATGKLPPGAELPSVSKVNTSLSPILVAILHGGKDYETMAYYAEHVIKKEFEKIQGVGEVHLGGYRDKVLWIRIDPERLYSRGLTVKDVVNAFKANHIEMPSGRIYSGNREYILRVYGKARSPEEVNEFVIRNGVKIKDIGRAEFTYDERRSVTRFKGERSVVLVVYKQVKSNTVRTANLIKEKIEELNRTLPEGMRIDVNYDSSVFIKRSVDDALIEIVLGSLLTSLAVFLFLGNIRMSIIPLMAIPVSILGTMFVIGNLGYSLNMITLIALAVAVGIVIDDAIVVLESIYRRTEEGLEGKEAAEKGTRIVVFALLASTASIVVIFLPIIFLKGVIGKFFNAFGVTLITAIAISFIVAISFTPMLSARLVKRSEKENPFMRIYRRFEDVFDVSLRWALNHKLVVIALSILSIVGGYFMLKATKKEFHPMTDEGRFVIRFETPSGSSLEFTDSKVRKLEEILESNPYIKQYSIAFGEGIFGRADANGGMAFVTLIDRRKRPHQKEVMQMVREKIKEIKDFKATVEVPAIVGGGAGRMVDIQYVIKGPSLEKLEEIANVVTEKLKKMGGYVDVDTNLKINKPEVRIYIDRAKAGEIGVTVEDIAFTLNALFGKMKIGTYEVGSESYDVYIKADEDFLNNFENLKKVYVRTQRGDMVPLSSLITYELKPGYNVINRYDRQYSFSLFANLYGKSQGEATAEIEGLLNDILPDGYTYEVAGMAKEFREAFKGLAQALVIALVGMYMILASLFESFLHPFTVMLTLPLAISGVFGLLLITGTSLSVPSYFGIILLMGIVARDAVLFIERIIQLRKEGMEMRDAIMQARKERLRPILMTTITIVFALLPVALGLFEGSELRKPMAIAVIGGIMSALPLSLYVIPVIYEIVDKINLKRLFPLRPS